VSIGEMSLVWVFIMWTAWALFGSSINYFLGYYLWERVIKSLINKYWKYLFIKVEHYEKAEKYFKKHWSITTFVGRLITIVRQYISLPAGVFKMNFVKFIIYTALWAGIWNIILITIWYIAWENIDLIAKYSKEVSIWLIIFIILLVWVYIFIQKKKNAKK
jgi:membrane protein DedA with SNARE-associated domain